MIWPCAALAIACSASAWKAPPLLRMTVCTWVARAPSWPGKYWAPLPRIAAAQVSARMRSSSGRTSTSTAVTIPEALDAKPVTTVLVSRPR